MMQVWLYTTAWKQMDTIRVYKDVLRRSRYLPDTAKCHTSFSKIKLEPRWCSTSTSTPEWEPGTGCMKRMQHVTYQRWGMTTTWNTKGHFLVKGVVENRDDFSSASSCNLFRTEKRCVSRGNKSPTSYNVDAVYVGMLQSHPRAGYCGSHRSKKEPSAAPTFSKLCNVRADHISNIVFDVTYVLMFLLDAAFTQVLCSWSSSL